MIVIASDHAGVDLKARLVRFLEAVGRRCRDLGPQDESSVDYPDFAHRLAQVVAIGETEKGILICGTGIGMSMTANRHSGVRAALCHDAFTAEMARRHNDANVLCMGARVLGVDMAEQITQVFLDTEFEGGRHQRRVEKIEIRREES
ncbi:MAG: ribose 5-phosphate isomerase B [Thermoanaerobaculales bacterium]